MGTLTSKRFAGRVLDLNALVIGVVFGVGTNLITSSPENWWPPLRPVADYAKVWLPLAVILVVVSELSIRRYRGRQVIWRRTDNPYPGLESFTRERAPVFFGRNEAVRELGSRLKRTGRDPRARFIPVVGPSGSGKTSLIQAGILPRLTGHWAVIRPFSPGTDPFLALVSALTVDSEGPRQHQRVNRSARLLRDEAAALSLQVTSTTNELSTYLLAAQGQKSRILIVIDQWEELTTLASTRDCDLFVRMLHTALAKHPTLHVLATLRPDALADFTGSANPALFGPPYPIGALEPRFLRQAIEGPAHAAGAEFEPGLVEQMVAEATIGDALPLLGHLLERLYENMGRDKVITVEDYDKAGRVAGAIAAHADEIYHELAVVYPAEKVDHTLLTFVHWGGREAVRRAVPAAKLDDIGRRIADEFRAERLIVDVSGGSEFELAHDALLRQWDKLHDLVVVNERKLRKQALLEQRAQDWQTGSGADDLLRGQALNEAEEFRQMSPAIADFVTASRAVEHTEMERRSAQAAAYAQQMRQHDNELALAVAVAAVKELVPSPAAILTLWGMVDHPNLTRLAMGHVAQVCTMAWLDDEKLLSIAKDGTSCVWDHSGSLVEFSTLPQKFRNARLSQNGRRLWLEEEDGCASLWIVDDYKLIARSRSEHNYASNIKWSCDGSQLLLRPIRGEAEILFPDELEDGLRVRSRNMPTPTNELPTWSPNGKLLAFPSNDMIVVVESTDGARVGSIATSSKSMHFSWSPDSLHICVVTETSNPKVDSSEATDVVTLYNIEGRRLASRNATKVKFVAWAPKGDCIAVLLKSGSTGSNLELWDSTTLVKTKSREVGILNTEFSWSANGTHLAYFSHRGDVTIWNIQTAEICITIGGHVSKSAWNSIESKAIVSFLGHESAYAVSSEPGEISEFSGLPTQQTLSWSSTGSHFATGARGQVEIRPSHPGRPLARLTISPETIMHLTWSPDTKYLAIACQDFWKAEANRVTIWRWSDDQTVVEMIGDGQQRGPLAWSPDNSLLMGHGAPGLIIAWSAETGEQLFSIKYPRKLTAICWPTTLPNLIAVAGDDYRIQVLELKSGDTVASCIGHTSDVKQLTWSPDGRYLTSASSDHEVRLWNGLTGECLVVLDGPGEGPHLCWSEDGRRLTAASIADNLIHTWSMPQDGHDLAAKVEVTRTLTKHDRQRAGLSLDVD